MEQLVNFLNRQLPAFWGAILILPLVQQYLPDLYTLIKIDNLHVAIAIAIWLIIYEITIMHVLAPISSLILLCIAMYVPIYSSLIKLMPLSYSNKVIARHQQKINNQPARKTLALRLVRQHITGENAVRDSYADELARMIGEQELAKNNHAGEREATSVFSIALTSLIAGLLYLCFPPQISLLPLDGFYLAIFLLVSAVLTGVLGITLSGQEDNERYNLAILKLKGINKD